MLKYKSVIFLGVSGLQTPSIRANDPHRLGQARLELKKADSVRSGHCSLNLSGGGHRCVL